MVIHSTSTSDKIEHIFCFQCKEAPTRPDTRRSSIPKSEASGFELKISQQRASNCSSCLRRCLKVTQNDKGAFWLRGSVIILFSISFYLQREKIYTVFETIFIRREKGCVIFSIFRSFGQKYKHLTHRRSSFFSAKRPRGRKEGHTEASKSTC